MGTGDPFGSHRVRSFLSPQQVLSSEPTAYVSPTFTYKRTSLSRHLSFSSIIILYKQVLENSLKDSLLNFRFPYLNSLLSNYLLQHVWHY